MKHHRVFWFIAILSVVIAVLSLVLRQTSFFALFENIDDAQYIKPLFQALDEDPQIRLESTRKIFEQVSKINHLHQDNQALMYYLQGMRLRSEGKYDEALELFRKAIQVRPEWSRPYNAVGIVLYRLGKYEEAELALRKAIEIEPHWSRAHNDYAVMLRLQGRLSEALQEARKALELAPDDVSANNNYGNLLLAMGKLDDAKIYYKKANLLNPSHPAPIYNLACVFALQGNQEEAMSLLIQVLKIDPSFWEEIERDPHLESLREHPLFLNFQKNFLNKTNPQY